MGSNKNTVTLLKKTKGKIKLSTPKLPGVTGSFTVASKAETEAGRFFRVSAKAAGLFLGLPRLGA